MGDFLHHYKEQNLAGMGTLLSLPLGFRGEILSDLLLQHKLFLQHVLQIIWPKAASSLVLVRRGGAALR